MLALLLSPVKSGPPRSASGQPPPPHPVPWGSVASQFVCDGLRFPAFPVAGAGGRGPAPVMPPSLFLGERTSPFPSPPHLVFLSPHRGERRGEGGFQSLSPPGRGQGEGASLTGPPYPRTFPGSKPRRPGPAGRSSVTHATPFIPPPSPLIPLPPPGGGARGGGHPPRAPPSREGEKDSGERISPFPSPPTGGRGIKGEGGLQSLSLFPWGRGPPLFPLPPVGGEGLGEGGATLPAPLPQGRGKRTRGRGQDEGAHSRRPKSSSTVSPAWRITARRVPLAISL